MERTASPPGRVGRRPPGLRIQGTTLGSCRRYSDYKRPELGRRQQLFELHRVAGRFACGTATAAAIRTYSLFLRVSSMSQNSLNRLHTKHLLTRLAVAPRSWLICRDRIVPDTGPGSGESGSANSTILRGPRLIRASIRRCIARRTQGSTALQRAPGPRRSDVPGRSSRRRRE